jgi:plastocyanin
MNKNTLWAVIAAIVIIIAGVWLFRGKTDTVTTGTDTTQGTAGTTSSPTPTTGTPSTTPTSSGATGGTTVPAPTTVNVTGGEFYFQPSTITVKKGQTVTIHFTNVSGSHNWVIDAFNARTPVIGAGKTADVTFIASKTGSFEYYCSVGNHRAMGMKGTLIVQ